MRIPDTGQISDLICSCKNEASALRAVWGAYRESGSLRSCNGMERRRASARCARQYPAAERSSQKTYKPPAAQPRRWNHQQKQWSFLPLLFLVSIVSPLFLPYLRQLRQVPVMPGGAAEPYSDDAFSAPYCSAHPPNRRLLWVRSPRRKPPVSLFARISWDEFVQIVRQIYKTSDCILRWIMLKCTRRTICISCHGNFQHHISEK